jgi:hypothetical protein
MLAIFIQAKRGKVKKILLSGNVGCPWTALG